MPTPGPIAPLPAATVPPILPGDTILTRATAELAAWLVAFNDVPGLVTGGQNALVVELDRALGLDASLGVAQAARAALVPGLGLDSLSPILTAPAPWLVTGQALPVHPGNGGNVPPAATFGADMLSYSNSLIQTVINYLFGAPIA